MNNKLRNTFFTENLLAAFLVSVNCVLAAAASPDVPRFVDPPFTLTNIASSAMVTADFNGDGIPDVGSINHNGSEIGVTLSNGDGTFQPTQIYNVGDGPNDMKTADLNGDGTPDLVVALLGNVFEIPFVAGHSVAVLLGNGDGTFGRPVKFEAGQSPSSVAVSDLNEDGKIDVVVSNAGPRMNGVRVLLGNGDGTLQLPVAYETGDSTRSVVLSDFNGDGHVDAAVVNSFSDTFTVLLGNGDGTFGTPVNYPTPYGDPFYLVVADFDHDSHPDLAVTYGEPRLNVSVFLGNRDGTFQTAIDTQMPFYYPRNLVAVDLNGDTIPDLVVADGALTVLLGKGDGTFETPVGYFKRVGVVTLGQFDGAGGLDALVDDYMGRSGFAFIAGNSDGTFNAPRSFPALIHDVSTATGDLNHDGKADVVVAGTPSVADTQGYVSVFLNTSGGVFAPRVDYPTGHDPMGLAIGDLNKDGVPDLVTGNQSDNSVSVLLGTGGGVFQDRTDYSTGTLPASVLIADFNNDGTQDLATLSSNFPAETISILLGAGDGSFPTHTEFPTLNFPSMAAGDLNGDGNLDLAVVGQRPQGEVVSVFLGKGDGTFDGPTNYSITGADVRAELGIADVNGDSKPDVVAVNFLAVTTLLNNGDGTFQPPVTSAGILYVASLQLGDIDGNGSVDLVVGSYNLSFQNDLLLGNGDGTFSPPEHFFEFSIGTALADFNNDGALDVADVESSVVSILLNTGGSHVSLLSSENPSHAGEQVTFLARVSPTVSSATPSGTVEFLDRGQTLATVALVDGNARFTTSSLSIGRHGIHARYSGDTIFVPRESKTKAQIVQP